MTVLGFDTSTPATAVGLRSSDGTVLRAYDEPAPGGRPGHASQLLTLARELLAQAGADWGEIERIAVGVGPGTFTGLRVGIATARGLAQSLGAELVGVGSLRVLAQAALGESATTHDSPRSVLAMIDARRGEAFLAAYDAKAELAPPRALPPQQLAPLVAELGPDREWVAVGDGALRFQGHLEALAVAVPADASPLHRIDAGVLCELAADAPPGDPAAVLPDYRRRPDAEIALDGTAAPDPSAASVRMNSGSKS
jgi:tRNA threonylcarbamoyladenosine biosynthesis protein TsaB